MLTPFDWLRLCRNGTELIATLHLLEKQPDAFRHETIGQPFSALHAPCERCGIFARAEEMPASLDVEETPEDAGGTASLLEAPVSPEDGLSPLRNIAARYCPACSKVRLAVPRFHHTARHAVMVWGALSPLPELPRSQYPVPTLYRHDEQHFLLVLRRAALQDWLSGLLLRHGLSLTGLLQIVPTLSPASGWILGDMLARLPSYESIFSPDRMRVRFYPAGHIVFRTKEYERAGVLTFDAQEFAAYLGMAGVFRSLLLPEQQEAVFEILRIKDLQEQQFHWGRLLGLLSPEARSMLLSWRPRSWSKQQIYLLDKLRPYAKYSPTH